MEVYASVDFSCMTLKYYKLVIMLYQSETPMALLWEKYVKF